MLSLLLEALDPSMRSSSVYIERERMQQFRPEIPEEIDSAEWLVMLK